MTDQDWTKPAAKAIPKEGYFELERGRYGPIYPRTPACYGFSIIAKVKEGREETVRAYGKTIEDTIAFGPKVHGGAMLALCANAALHEHGGVGALPSQAGGPPACGGEFLAWEPYSHMTFRFNEASTDSIAAFAEDYRIVPTAGGCHLTWGMAMKPKGVAARLGMSLGRPVMARTFQKFLYNLRDYTNERFANGG